jgi:hypothetical protein
MVGVCEQIALDNMQRQYGYTNVSDLVMKRAAVWDKFFGGISDTFEDEVLNIDTCTSSALDYYWGKRYKLSRVQQLRNGEVVTFDDATYRKLLKIRAFGCYWDGTPARMNDFLKKMFKNRGEVYMIDSQDMTIRYEFLFQLESWESFVFADLDILPRQAGVGVEVHVFDPETTFGFTDTGLQPWSQGVLYKGKV